MVIGQKFKTDHANKEGNHPATLGLPPPGARAPPRCPPRWPPRGSSLRRTPGGGLQKQRGAPGSGRIKRRRVKSLGHNPDDGGADLIYHPRGGASKRQTMGPWNHRELKHGDLKPWGIQPSKAWIRCPPPLRDRNTPDQSRARAHTPARNGSSQNIYPPRILMQRGEISTGGITPHPGGCPPPLGSNSLGGGEYALITPRSRKEGGGVRGVGGADRRRWRRRGWSQRRGGARPRTP